MLAIGAVEKKKVEESKLIDEIHCVIKIVFFFFFFLLYFFSCSFLFCGSFSFR